MKTLKCILLVDDNPGDLYLHSYLIKEYGFCQDIKKALDGREALSYLEKAIVENGENGYPVPDLILLDINMPGMNGFEFLHEFKKCSWLLHKPVIIMVTSSTDSYEIKRAMKTGIVKDWINKPLEYEVMTKITDKYF